MKRRINTRTIAFVVVLLALCVFIVSKIYSSVSGKLQKDDISLKDWRAEVISNANKKVEPTNIDLKKPNSQTTLPSGSCNTFETITFYNYVETNPVWEQNNKFGLYIYAENKDYFEIAQQLVNSNGGKWGYVLIPYNVRDRDSSKWERVFEDLYEKKLIPVIQLHDVEISKYKKQTKEAAQFLNSFLWPIKYRYISVYNEPNSADFWYGRVDPKEYAQILSDTVDIFKEENKDFFMLNGALNASAPNANGYMDSFEFMRRMDDEVDGVFEKLDGWASHSYPQPNFSGSPYDTGRWSIKAYDSELSYLKDVLKVKKELPVFITETGWAHAEGERYNSSYYSVDTISKYFSQAYTEVWLPDARVRAVMPFTVWYAAPHDHFSWINKDKVPYAHYEAVKNLKKAEGAPPVLKQNKLENKVCLN